MWRVPGGTKSLWRGTSLAKPCGFLLQRLPALPEAVNVAGTEASVLSWARAFFGTAVGKGGSFQSWRALRHEVAAPWALCQCFELSLFADNLLAFVDVSARLVR